MADKEDEIVKEIGKLIREAHELEEAEISLESQRVEKLISINNELLPEIQAKHREIKANIFAVDRLKLLAWADTDDEDLARGKAALREDRNFNVSSDQLQSMHEVLAEIGISDPVSRSSQFSVGADCHWCTGGCKSTSRANPQPPGCKHCYGTCEGSCIGTCETACGSSCWGLCYGGPGGE